MSSEIFASAVKRISEGQLPLGELITAAEALKREGKDHEISQLYALWIRMNPNDALLHVACFNSAVVESDRGNLAEAKQLLETAIGRNADFYPAYINYGNVLERLGDPAGAIAQWTALANRLGMINGPALTYKITAMKQLGRVLENHRITTNAEQVLRQSLELNPNQHDVMQHYVALRLAQCEWPIIIPFEGMTRQMLVKGTGPLSMNNYTDDAMLQLASGWNYCKNVIGWPETDHRGGKPKAERSGRRKRIGYISSDLRHHAVGFIMAELFELHNRQDYEVFAYYCGIDLEDPLKDRIRNSVEHWTDLKGMSDEQVAQRIVDDGIDILVDVNGYTKDARTKVFAMRPAPVIVNWLGFPGSMGSPYHHYIVADDYIIPQSHEKFYSEKVLRMPCYQPNDRKRKPSDKKPTRAEMGLPDDAFVFCSFNGVQKLSRFTFDRWLEILRRVPKSVLWMLGGDEGVQERLQQYAAQHGVAAERIIFAGKMGNPEHLARYPLADLFLDGVPYGAHVTASDALWMGVPILTMSGRSFAARVCGSLVTAAGMPELICAGPKEYVERAVALGHDKAEVARLKQKLSAQRDTCTLFDAPGMTKKLEGLYEDMWADYLADRLPRPDLTNMEIYYEIGSEFDHDAEEMFAVTDYEERYREKLAKRHDYSPVAADSRLWTKADIAKADGKPAAEVHSLFGALRRKK